MYKVRLHIDPALERDKVREIERVWTSVAAVKTDWGIGLPLTIMTDILFDYHTIGEAFNFAQVSDDAKAAYEKKIKIRFLEYIAKNQQADTQYVLNRFSVIYGTGLLSFKCSIQENSGPVYQDITAIQYTIWTGKSEMLKMLLNFLPRKEAVRQINDLKINGFKCQLITAPSADQKADQEREEHELKIKIDLLFAEAKEDPLKLSVVVIASAQCVDLEIYNKSLTALLNVINKMANNSFKAWMLGRAVWAAKLIHDPNTLKRYLPQLREMLPSLPIDAQCAHAWSYLAAADVKNYKKIEPYMLEATDHLQRIYLKPELTDHEFWVALSDYMWSIILNAQAAAQVNNIRIGLMRTESLLQGIFEGYEALFPLAMKFPEQYGQAWAVGILASSIDKIDVEPMDDSLCGLQTGLLEQSIRYSRDLNLKEQALMGRLHKLGKLGSKIEKREIPDLREVVQPKPLAKAMIKQPVHAIIGTPSSGYRFNIRYVYKVQRDSKDTLVVIALLTKRINAIALMEPQDYEDRVEVNVEKRLPTETIITLSITELEQAKKQFKGAECIYASKIKRHCFFRIIETTITENRPAILVANTTVEDGEPQLPKCAKPAPIASGPTL